MIGHVGLAVVDLDPAIDFFEQVLGFEVLGRDDEPGARYAFLGIESTISLTLWEQAATHYDKSSAGLHHLAFSVPDESAVRAVEEKLRKWGGEPRYGGVVAHREGSSSGGLFFDGPEGIRLEVSTANVGVAVAAPHGDRPTCGFF